MAKVVYKYSLTWPNSKSIKTRVGVKKPFSIELAVGKNRKKE
jgi:hypothetical protein